MKARYPFGPGVRAGSPDTAYGAAEAIAPAARSYEEACLAFVREAPITPDEAHVRLERELQRDIPLYSVRPRFSTLKARGLIKDSGERRAPPNGRKAVVWRAATGEELALFYAQKAADAEKRGGAE